jgi:iron complex outermembrane receptor protein
LKARAPPGRHRQSGRHPAPSVSRQIEAGARAEVRGVMANVAYFHINRALAYTDLATNTYLVNGRAVHEGVEASLQGNVTPNVSLMAAGQYLRAVQEKTGIAAQDGRWVDNAPRWSGSLFAEYRPPVLPGFGVNAGMYYTGRRYADATNLYGMAGYSTYSLGANYKLHLAHARTMTLRVNGDNITNKRYWSTGGTVFYAGLARQVRFSASMDF